jgi:hypothetical protein
MISLKGLTQGKSNKTENDAPKGNIFGKSLNVGQVQRGGKSTYLESKNQKKAFITLGLSVAVLAVYSILFFYGNVMAYLSAPAEISSLRAENQEYTEVILPSMEKTRDLHKSAYDEQFDEVISALNTVFPEGIDKLGFIKLLESFASEVAASFPPFEFTSITLANPIEEDGYIITPASTSIHSSLSGFDKFLSLVDRSGYIYTGEGEDRKVVDKKIRLMSISNISVKYRGVNEETGKDEGVDFSVKLNIYSRPETKNN